MKSIMQETIMERMRIASGRFLVLNWRMNGGTRISHAIKEMKMRQARGTGEVVKLLGPNDAMKLGNAIIVPALYVGRSRASKRRKDS